MRQSWFALGANEERYVLLIAGSPFSGVEPGIFTCKSWTTCNKWICSCWQAAEITSLSKGSNDLPSQNNERPSQVWHVKRSTGLAVSGAFQDQRPFTSRPLTIRLALSIRESARACLCPHAGSRTPSDAGTPSCRTLRRILKHGKAHTQVFGR